MFKIKSIFSFGLLAAVAMPALTSCNDDWKEEKYKDFVSFKAPLDTQGTAVGVTTVYVPYTRVDENGQPLYGQEGMSHYQLPVLIAGSLDNPNDKTVNIAHSDTLDILNVERFGHRSEVYYHDMWDFTEVPSTVYIPKGQNSALLNIKVDFADPGFDQIDRYILPITVAPGAGYERNPRKNYATAMLRLLPYTDFSGIYQAGNLLYNIVTEDHADEGVSAGLSTVQTYACGQNKVFFYAGNNDEKSLLRRNFRIYAEFEKDETFVPSTDVKECGTCRMYVDSSENPELNFEQVGEASYKILESEDAVQTYIVRRTMIVQDIEYYYTDTKTAPGSAIIYKVAGTMTMERKLNTQMPEEDQIIWD